MSKRAFNDVLKQMKSIPRERYPVKNRLDTDRQGGKRPGADPIAASPKPKARGGKAKPRGLMPGEPLEPYRAGERHKITEPEGSHDA